MFRIILARILYMWGSLHRNFGNQSSFVREHRAAVHRFTQAYNLDPSLRRARLDRGIIFYRELRLLDEAMADFDGLINEDPSYGPALLNRAMVYQEKGQYSNALTDLEIYLNLPVEDEEYWQIASRTSDLLREIVVEMSDPEAGEDVMEDPAENRSDPG